MLLCMLYLSIYLWIYRYIIVYFHLISPPVDHVITCLLFSMASCGWVSSALLCMTLPSTLSHYSSSLYSSLLSSFWLLLLYWSPPNAALLLCSTTGFSLALFLFDNLAFIYFICLVFPCLPPFSLWHVCYDWDFRVELWDLSTGMLPFAYFYLMY